MLFSIIIPLYNSEESIERVLTSIYRQKFPKNDFEIICVDDKSKDATVKIVKKFKNIKLIELPYNKGNGEAKNVGASVAQGKILFFLDDHMYLDENALSSLKTLFEKYPNISGICGYYQSDKKTDYNIFRDIRRRTLYKKTDSEKIISLRDFIPFSISIGALRKELFQEKKFPCTFKQNSAEDVAFQIEHLNKGRIFLYSPKIKGIHDHNLNIQGIKKKIIIEIKGTGDLLYHSLRYSPKNKIPFLYGFLNYPLSLSINFILLFIHPFFIITFLLSLAIELSFLIACFKDKKTNVREKVGAFLYLFASELILKTYYLLYYLAKRYPLFLTFSYFRVFFEWEKEKIKTVSIKIFKNKNENVRYHKSSNY